jgi:seryl-tRNA(Sec) selenium transferase
LARLAVCSPLALAALGGTAAVVRSWGDDFALHLPAWQLLSAPLENLEQRARRLAPQIEALDANLQATPVRREAAWLRCGDAEATAATWTIEVRPREGSIAVLEGRARTAVPPLISAVEDGAAVVDLRSVFARWDRRLVEVLGGGAPSRSWSKIDVDDGGVK